MKALCNDDSDRSGTRAAQPVTPENPFTTSQHLSWERASPPCARGEPYSLTKYVRCKEPPSKVSPCKKKSLISIQFGDRQEPVPGLSAQREDSAAILFNSGQPNSAAETEQRWPSPAPARLWWVNSAANLLPSITASTLPSFPRASALKERARAIGSELAASNVTASHRPAGALAPAVHASCWR